MDAYIDELLDMFAAPGAPIPAERRPAVVDDKIVNPRTGKLVRLDGKVGRQVLAQQRAALEAAGAVLPRGNLRGPQVARPVPGLVEVDHAFIAQIRGNQRAGAFRLQRWGIPGPPPETVAQFARAVFRAVETTPREQRRHVNIALVDEEGNRIMRAVHGRTAAQLAEQIDQLQGKGVPTGSSDAIGTAFVLDTSSFAVGSVHPPGGGALKFTGISTKNGTRHPHFRLIDFSGKLRVAGDCLLAIMRAVASALGIKPATGWPRNATIRVSLGLPAAPANIDATDLAIGAVADYFGLRVRVVTGMAVPPDAEREYDDNPARLLGRNSCRTIAAPVVIASGGPEAAPPCDVYLGDEHYEYIADHLRVRTCPVTGDIIEGAPAPVPGRIAARVVSQGRRYYADDPNATTAARQALDENGLKAYKDHVIVFDYETIYRPDDGILEPYALGYIVFDPSDEELGAGDFSSQADRVIQILRAREDTRYAVTNPLLDTLCNAPHDVRYTLVSFNGARFDNFLLAQAANNRDLLTSVFATSAGGLRDVRIGRHRTLDLAKLCPAMSLKSACRGFKTIPRKVEGYSHLEPQAAFESGALYEWMDENRAKLAEYLAGDVLCEASLFQKLTKTLTKLSGNVCFGDRAVGTIGGHAWKMMNASCELPCAVASEDLDRHIRSSIIGGRVEVYDTPTHGKASRIELEPAYMVDFASLYPTVMAAGPSAAALFERLDGWGVYPDAIGAIEAGAQAARRCRNGANREKVEKAASDAAKAFKRAHSEPVQVADYQPGDIGLYKVTIHEQPPGLPNLVPRRGETLDWGYRGEFDAVISHVTIALIRRYGGRVTVHDGYVWRKATAGLFEPFIRTLAAIKDTQDSLDAASPEYNPALRMVVKLLMNSASGKCCQANYDDVVVIARGSAAQLAAERKMDSEQPTTWIPLGGETCIIIGKKQVDKVYTARAKPSILAALIYEYSRALVWRTLCQHNVLYSDTDSGLFSRADYEALRAAFPGLDPSGRAKVLGDLEQELKPHASALAFRLAPKDYGIFLYGADGKLLPGWKNAADEMEYAHKIRMKGVNQRSDRLLKPGASDLLRGRPPTEFASAYNAASLQLSRPLNDPEVALEMYERRAAGESVDVLCSQLMRGTLSVDRPLELYQRFLIKRLSGYDATTTGGGEAT